MTAVATTGTQAIGNGVSSVSVLMPASSTNDVTVVGLFTAGGGGHTHTVPNGWTAVFGAGIRPSGQTLYLGNVFWRAWQSGDPATQAFAMAGGAGQMVALPVRIRGGKASSPFEAVASSPIAVTNADTDILAPSVAAAASRLLLTFHAGATTIIAQTTWTPPPDMTELVDATSTASAINATGEMSSLVLTGAGPTGTKGAKANQQLYPVAFSMLVREPTATTLRMKGGVPVTIRYKGQP
jgi:hypothetical protein